MRLAYLTPTFPPYPGGIGVNAYYNALEMQKRGFQVEVFTPCYNQEFGADRQKQDFKVHYLNSLFSYGKAALSPQLLWRLRGFDIVHCYYPFFGGMEMAALARKIWHFKLVLHHEMDTVGEGWLKTIFSFHSRRILPWLLKNIDLLLVLSEDYFKSSDVGRLYQNSGQTAENFSGLAAVDRRLPPWQVVPNGVDTNLFHPRDCSPSPQSSPIKGEEEKNISPPLAGGVRGGGVILFAAGLDKAHYFKGVPVLLEAMAILKKQNFPARLSIAGDGELKNAYQKMARDLGLADLVDFVGLVKHDVLPDFYATGDLFVMPAVGRTESFSIATVEAQACGLPVIVSDLPGLRATIQSGVTGLLIKTGEANDLAQKIKTILSDPDLAKKMGQAGRERVVENYSWQVVGDRIEVLYNKLIINK